MSKVRFTGKWPPSEMLAQYPNWVFAWEEDRSGQDETSIKPSRNQQYLSEDVAYTAGDAWFPDDIFYPALINLRDFEPIGLVVYEEDGIWQIDYDYRTDKWTPCSSNSPPVDLQDPTRFPLRFITTLPESKKLGEIRRIISSQGFAREWIYDG